MPRIAPSRQGGRWARRRRSLRTRLLGTIAVMLLPLVALSVVAAYAFDTAVSRFAAAAAETEGEAVPLARLSSSIRFLEPPAYGAYLGDDPRGVGQYEEAVSRTRAGFAEVSREVDDDEGREAAMLARAQRSFVAADRELRRLLRMPVEERARIGMAGLVGFNRHVVATSSALDDTEAYALDQRRSELVEARDTEQRTLALLAAVCLAAFAVAILAARRLAGLVLAPVGLLRSGAARLGAGDLSHRVSLERDDELGDLAAAFDAMAGELQRSQEELAFRALHDPLTDLANRALLRDRLEHALTAGARRGERIALLMVDLDGFKAVNDSLGHVAGDRALVASAHRLAACVREADTLARLGGDEFALLLEGVADDAAAVEVARRLVDALRPPLQVDGSSIALGASVGVVVASEHDTAEALLRAADVALYRAKQSGKGRVELFAPALLPPEAGPSDPRTGLLRALDAGELTIRYHPVVGLGSGRVTEVTAVACWPHPERGLLTADDLLPLADGCDAADPLAEWVLEQACRQLRVWQESAPSAARLRLGTTLSSPQLCGERLVGTVAEALDRHGVAPARLVVAVSERTVVEQGERARERLAELRRLGVRIAVEGFGTGYSSLGNLRRTPVDRLTVDRTFVEGLGRGGLEGALASAVVALAGSLRLETVADGVSDRAQVAALVAAGCRLGWGPLFAPALDARAVGTLLAADQPLRRAPAYA